MYRVKICGRQYGLRRENHAKGYFLDQNHFQNEKCAFNWLIPRGEKSNAGLQQSFTYWRIESASEAAIISKLLVVCDYMLRHNDRLFKIRVTLRPLPHLPISDTSLDPSNSTRSGAPAAQIFPTPLRIGIISPPLLTNDRASSGSRG